MDKKSISSVFIWQLLGKFAIQGIAFITVPIFTRIMSPADYGQYAVYSSWLSLLTLFIGLQTAGSIPNAKIKYTSEEYQKYLSSALSISCISFSIIFLVAGILRKKIGILLGYNSNLIILMVIHSFLNYCFDFYLSKLIQDKDSRRNALYSIIVSLSGTILALVLILNINYPKYLLKIFGYLIPLFFAGVFAIIEIFRKGKTTFDKRYWKYCIGFSLPLIMHGAACIVLTQSDRIMLKALQNESEAGIYSVAYNLALVISVIMTAANTTWIPFYYEYEKKNDTEQIKIRFKNYLTNFTVITLGFILCCPEVFKILAPVSYWSGLKLLPIIAFAYYFNFLYTFPGNFEFYMEKMKFFSSATIIAAIINIFGNYLLIPKYGIIGAGLTTLYSYVFLLIFHDIVARFVIKGKVFFINKTSYLKGIVPVAILSVIYYLTLDLWYIRWTLAVILGAFLLVRLIKNRSFF